MKTRITIEPHVPSNALLDYLFRCVSYHNSYDESELDIKEIKRFVENDLNRSDNFITCTVNSQIGKVIIFKDQKPIITLQYYNVIEEFPENPGKVLKQLDIETAIANETNNH